MFELWATETWKAGSLPTRKPLSRGERRGSREIAETANNMSPSGMGWTKGRRSEVRGKRIGNLGRGYQVRGPRTLETPDFRMLRNYRYLTELSRGSIPGTRPEEVGKRSEGDGSDLEKKPFKSAGEP